MCFDEKIAIITGATSGIGRATALLLSSLGATVVLTARRELDGAKLVDEITQNGNQASFIKTDVSDEKEVMAFFDEVREKYHKIDIAVIK